MAVLGVPSTLMRRRPTASVRATMAATAGAIAAGTAEELAVTADATALAPGSYRALLCVATNDPQARMVRVAVDLRVHPDGTLFRDGFDAP